MNTVRRDQSISPMDRSITRNAEVRKLGAGGRERVMSMRMPHAGYFTKYWKTACRLSSGEVTSSIVPYSPLAASSVTRV
jgi:hypothetical protein